jgi:hypothetical protein
MNRQIWAAVLVTVGLMGATSVLQHTDAWRTNVASARRELAELGGPAWRWAAEDRDAIGVGTAAIGVLLLVGIRRRRPERRGQAAPWQQVIEMATSGQEIDEIARATHLAQDAVRILLTPVPLDPALPPGRTFRHDRPVPAPSPVRPKPGRRR